MKIKSIKMKRVTKSGKVINYRSATPKPTRVFKDMKKEKQKRKCREYLGLPPEEV